MNFFKKRGLKEFKSNIEKQAKLKTFNEKLAVSGIKKPHFKLILLAFFIFIAVLVIELFSELKVQQLNIIAEQISKINLSLQEIIIITTASCLILLILYLIFRKKSEKYLAKKEEEIEFKVHDILEKEKEFKNELETLLKKARELSKKHPERKKAKKLYAEINHILNNPTKDYNEIKKVLGLVDKLFLKLPKEEIENFADSEESEIYEKLMKKYGVK